MNLVMENRKDYFSILDYRRVCISVYLQRKVNEPRHGEMQNCVSTFLGEQKEGQKEDLYRLAEQGAIRHAEPNEHTGETRENKTGM